MLESEPVIQKEINKEYRRSRFEALVIVCDRCNTTNDTLFLSMAIIDKFLAVKEVKAEDFIFLALSAVRLAWKMEEVQDEKERKEFHSNVEAIEEMENKILKVLDWRLVIPHALSFIGIFNIMEDIQYKYHVLSEYIAEVATTHFNPREYAPSMIAAASVYLARKMANLTPWVFLAVLFSYLLSDSNTRHRNWNRGIESDSICGCCQSSHENTTTHLYENDF